MVEQKKEKEKKTTTTVEKMKIFERWVENWIDCFSITEEENISFFPGKYT